MWRVARAMVASAAALVLVLTGVAWWQYQRLDEGVRRSGALAGLAPAAGTAQNLLVIGLDSRLDENGDPLPPALYAALDTGGADVGGYNANVLMLLHIPADGRRATAMSIPRDDYVDLAGSPDGVARGKIKQAYGLAFDQEHRALVAEGVTDHTQLEQRSRDAGRDAEIATVSQFLGGVPIDHFVEVTMVAFYQVAQVVQPITVCVNEDTRDSYSGADFRQGYQQIDAAQAVAFFRQRRDTAHPQLDFTDLDRERRQQAFIASLAYQLKQAGTLTNPTKLAGLIAVAKQNTAVDPGLDLLTFADQAASLTSGNVTFTTLPIDHFGTDPSGEDVNIVDLPTVRAFVANLLNPSSSTPGPTPAPTPAPAVAQSAVTVLNGSGRDGLAAAVAQTLTTRGYTVAGTGTVSVRHTSEVLYRPSDHSAAAALASAVGASALTPDSRLAVGRLELVLGTGYPDPPSAAPATPSTAATITGDGIPCVK